MRGDDDAGFREHGAPNVNSLKISDARTSTNNIQASCDYKSDKCPVYRKQK